MSKQTIKDKLLSGNGIFMYLRSVFASNISGFTDYIVSFVCFKWVLLSSALSTAVGATCGGVVNCLINYKFTFKCKGCSYAAIAVKFFLIWLGSLLLNSYGTEYCTDLLSALDIKGMSIETKFLIARVGVSLVVSILWNFTLQRFFVFRPNKFDHVVDYIVYRNKR